MSFTALFLFTTISGFCLEAPCSSVSSIDSVQVANTLYNSYKESYDSLEFDLAMHQINCAVIAAPFGSLSKQQFILEHAKLLLRFGDLNASYTKATQCLNSAKELGLNDLIGESAKILLEISETIGNESESQRYVELCFKHLTESSDSNKVADGYQALGSYYRGLNEIDSARKYLKIAQRIASNCGNEIIQLKSLNNLGLTYASTGNLIIAKGFFLRAAKKLQGNSIYIPPYCEVLNNISYLYLLTSKLDSAEFYARLQLSISQKIRYHLVEAKALLHLSNIYEEYEQFDSAYQYYLAYDQLNDSLFNAGVIQKIRMNNFLNEIEDLEIQNELNRISLENLRFRNGLLIGLAIIVLFALLLLFERYRNKQIEIELLFNRIQELIEHPSLEEQPIPEHSSAEISMEVTASILDNLLKWERENGFVNETTLDSLSKHCETNPKYLSNIIRTNYNQTFPDYINSRRIRYVLKKIDKEPEMLNYTIEAISQIAGYKSTTSFVSAFKKITKLTPSTYLKERRKRSENKKD